MALPEAGLGAAGTPPLSPRPLSGCDRPARGWGWDRAGPGRGGGGCRSPPDRGAGGRRYVKMKMCRGSCSLGEKLLLLLLFFLFLSSRESAAQAAVGAGGAREEPRTLQTSGDLDPRSAGWGHPKGLFLTPPPAFSPPTFVQFCFIFRLLPHIHI